jgi:hypothetical protein
VGREGARSRTSSWEKGGASGKAGGGLETAQVYRRHQERNLERRVSKKEKKKGAGAAKADSHKRIRSYEQDQSIVVDIETAIADIIRENAGGNP